MEENVEDLDSYELAEQERRPPAQAQRRRYPAALAFRPQVARTTQAAANGAKGGDRPEYVATAFVLNVKGAAPAGADPGRQCSTVGEDRTRFPIPVRRTLVVQLRSD